MEEEEKISSPIYRIILTQINYLIFLIILFFFIRIIIIKKYIGSVRVFLSSFGLVIG